MATEPAICVTVVWSPGARQVHEEKLRLSAGTTVLQAIDVLQVSGLAKPDAKLCSSALAMGIWGSKVNADQVLQDGDRLELYRPLKVDPKVARRARFEAQGARTAGLFARRRAGSKAGY